MTRKFLGLLASLFTFAAALHGTAIVIQLAEQAAVIAPEVRLGQIAGVTTSEPSLTRRLAQLEIMDAPSIGRSKLVSAFRVKSLIDSAGLGNAEVLGNQCVVTLKTRLAPDSEIKEAIRDWLALQDDGIHEMDISFVRLPSQWEIPDGHGVKLAVETRKTHAVGPTNLSLYAMSGDKVLATARARVDIQWNRDAAVLIRPLARGQALTSDHVDIRNSNVTGAHGMAIADPSHLTGMIASRDLPVGTVLTAHDVELPVLVKRGSLNRILVENGQIQMSITGAEALQNGKKGDFVLFRNPMNPKENLKAKVMGSGVALIEINPSNLRKVK